MNRVIMFNYLLASSYYFPNDCWAQLLMEIINSLYSKSLLPLALFASYSTSKRAEHWHIRSLFYLCISVWDNVYDSNSVYHTTEIASVVEFETIMIYPKILNMNSTSIYIDNIFFKSWLYFKVFNLMSLVLSLFVSKLVMNIFLAAICNNARLLISK